MNTHQLIENSSTVVADQIEAWEAMAAMSCAKLAGLRAVAAKFPDVLIERTWLGITYTSALAHDVATHYDPSCRFVRGEWARNVLYIDVAGVRVYSSRPVDLDAGFAAFQEPTYVGTLVDALRATTESAEIAERGYLAQLAQEREVQDAKDKAAAVAKALRDAQAVKVVNEVIVRSN